MSILTDSSDLLTTDQLATKLGISKRTLVTWVSRKTIPCIRIGDIVRFDWVQVKQAMLTTCEVSGLQSTKGDT